MYQVGEDMEVTVGKVSESVLSAHKRIDRLEKKVDDLTTLTTAVASLQTETKDIKSDVGEIKDSLKQVTSRPIKWWDKIVAAAIGACASGIVAAILATILK